MVLYLSTISYAPVAQLVEHLTFNQGVRDSSSRRSTNNKTVLVAVFFIALCEELNPVAKARDSQHCVASRIA